MTKENNTSGFQNLAKKAKRKSQIRMGIIAFIVCILVLSTFQFVGNIVISKTINKESAVDTMWNNIHGANITQQGTVTNYTLFSATTKTEFNKIVGDVAIPWVPIEKRYSLFGTSKRITTNGPVGSGHINDQRIPMYFNGERVIEFIHPKVNFNDIADDKEIISDIKDDKVIEVALSFDKAYSLLETQNTFGKSLSWFWVNTYEAADINDFNQLNVDTGKNVTISGDDVIGFSSNKTNDLDNGSALFISNIKQLSKEGSYKEIANRIVSNITATSNEKELSSANLEIIGVVVTGFPSEILELIESPMVRAVFLGSTVDKY
ncbi:hypothetical protein FC756_05460 [Lysinibacillus mangiferihumi]|uniref:Uncharacterized protein n=1 Tax=Lysinibacillus mangiferihumi TaxID=1130819 RepID=A0A4U2ZD65_9BACI|nr:anti sigma factor C-terminal domain-containing protein [Lysinibacillus mangiferihumi]TKI71550.1 hypothetical protein FC756_05460 [Lysinibacillus mangiferihumi]